MRNTVKFCHPEPWSDADGVLGVEGAGWFAELLRKLPGVVVDPELVQEDWGVVVLARHDGRNFWLGLNAMGEHEWLAHVHHGSFAWLQRFSAEGKPRGARWFVSSIASCAKRTRRISSGSRSGTSTFGRRLHRPPRPDRRTAAANDAAARDGGSDVRTRSSADLAGRPPTLHALRAQLTG